MKGSQPLSARDVWNTCLTMAFDKYPHVRNVVKQLQTRGCLVANFAEHLSEILFQPGGGKAAHQSKWKFHSDTPKPLLVGCDMAQVAPNWIASSLLYTWPWALPFSLDESQTKHSAFLQTRRSPTILAHLVKTGYFPRCTEMLMRLPRQPPTATKDWLMQVAKLPGCCVLPIIAEDGFRFPSPSYYEDDCGVANPLE